MRVISVILLRRNTLRCVESSWCRCWRRWPCRSGWPFRPRPHPMTAYGTRRCPRFLSAGAPATRSRSPTRRFESARWQFRPLRTWARSSCSSIGLGGSSPSTGNVAVGRVRGPQAIEYVIRRGGSQMGVPYSWGGGTPSGPSKGVDSGANIVGYDCSGFTRFAFAGVGVLIPEVLGGSVQHRPQGASVAGQTR